MLKSGKLTLPRGTLMHYCKAILVAFPKVELKLIILEVVDSSFSPESHRTSFDACQFSSTAELGFPFNPDIPYDGILVGLQFQIWNASVQ